MQRGALLLIAVLGSSAAMALAGCGGSSDADTESATTTAAPPASTTPASDAGSSAAAEPPASSAADAAGAVHLKLLSFTPEELEVTAGTTVEWVDDNPIAHTITSGTYEVGADGLRTSETPDGDVRREGRHHRRHLLVHVRRARHVHVLLLDPQGHERDRSS